MCASSTHFSFQLHVNKLWPIYIIYKKNYFLIYIYIYIYVFFIIIMYLRISSSLIKLEFKYITFIS